MTDIEKQGITSTTEQYGAIESNPKKSQELPLFLGRWAVAPDLFYKIALSVYVAWFVLHRVADIAYIVTVDARFPEGLGHLYPSEAQRLESVAYTREVLMCGFLHRCVVFSVVMALVYFKLFARFDVALREFAAGIPEWWENSYLKAFCDKSSQCCCAPIGRCLGFCCSPCGRCFSWFGRLKDTALNGRLATDISSRVGFPLTWRELLLGSVYLSIMGALFFTMSAPFMYWMQTIDLRFGFANSLVVSTSNFGPKFVGALISMLIMGVPQKFLFLAVLQYRLGWVLMWGGLFAAIIYAQYNVQMIAPMLGMQNQFPHGLFGVARGFPFVQTTNTKAPWISLNRLFHPDEFAAQVSGGDPKIFYTNDKSKGQLALSHQPSGKWSISGTAWFDPKATVYAETQGAAADTTGLKEQSWNVGGPTTAMGVRSGKALRDALFGFARDRKIGIGNIYLVDGSHKDARANAFVTGAGNHSIIGLYDTLFLGMRGSDAEESIDEDQVAELAAGKSMIEHVSELVQGVDVEGADRDRRQPRNSAQTSAMNDDEIVAILAHELAHSALKHMEKGMGVQILTSFVTFATLGWMAHSPLAGAALSLTAPLIHVGACAYDHLVGPPLDGFMKLFTDALTRKHEYEADAYAAMISEKYGTGLQTALAKLSINSNQDPDPPYFFEALHSDHPPFARRWEHIQKVKKKTYGKNTQTLKKP